MTFSRALAPTFDPQPASLLSWLRKTISLAALFLRIALVPALPAHAVPCPLNSPASAIQHIIYLQFDNVHFTRDNPNVPSDLEQMPHLLSFLTGNGTLHTKHHTPLISHTANDILTTLTGLYPDRHGVPVANSFRYFNPDGTTNLGVAFAYWTDPLFDPTTSTPSDTLFNMLTKGQKNAPAPWVTYTRAGCNFGAIATANIVLENIQTDIPTVFGSGSPQAMEVASNPNQPLLTLSASASTALSAMRSALPPAAASPILFLRNPGVIPDTRASSAMCTLRPRSVPAVRSPTSMAM